MTATITALPTRATTVADRVFESILGMVDCLSIYLGEMLGYYDTVSGLGSVTRGELADATGAHWRYVTEWLEQQAMTGFLLCDDPQVHPSARRYRFAPGVEEVLTDRASLIYLAPAIRTLVASATQIEGIATAHLTGGGVSWEEFGPKMRTGQAELNRPWFLNVLGSSWFPSVPELDGLLRGRARVADLGTGEGWSAIGIALSYPDVTVDGFDIDMASVQAARRHADELGLSERVRFHKSDAKDLALSSSAASYDVVTLFETVHDLPDPVSVLAAARELVTGDGFVLVMDERTRSDFTPDGDPIECLLYGYSLLICLPDGMSHGRSVGTGTVMRPQQLDAYARRAGFHGVETLAIEHDMWRFYRLTQ